MIANEYIQQGYSVSLILNSLKLSRSSYYYKPTHGKKGRMASTFTVTLSGGIIQNYVVVEEIKKLLEMEFVDYGYIKVTYWLRDNKEYIINPKKVYRLMGENNLLLSQITRNKIGKIWIKEFVPKPELPFEHWEFDIKYIYIHGERKNALLLTVIDVKSRWNMGWILQWSIKKYDVKSLLQTIIDDFCLPQTVRVRNDNGSQFESKVVRNFLIEQNIEQEFTRPATPQQNGHIESYHSILEKLICKRYEFDSIDHGREVFDRFEHFYNFNRIHSGVDYKSPFKYLLNQGVDMNKKI